MPKRFKIKGITDSYTLRPVSEVNLHLTEDCILSNIQILETANKLFISDTARSTIFDHIGWSASTGQNNVEQGGLLIGHSYVDESDSSVLGFVEYAIPALSAKGSMVYLEFNHDSWKSMMDQLDEMNATVPNHAELQIIGWYHTHPGRLSVFMSGTDLNTQRKMFSKDWQYAIVLNPQKQVWRAFNGKDSKECNGYILKQ
ncbi:hypothetical protein [uncultured Psychroserpens sp.]|uniref:hypothetical protein n=1 Tax=uncultured Psychroserpens sp. TaxID=255436 RepID=UPI002601CE14|nr:hypothetical protein [uncultured Psychroserpens sp.]